MISGAFALSGALAAVVALVLVAQTGVADVRMGGQIMLVAFIATVVGGMGSLSGAVAAGLGIGAASALLQAGLPADARPFRKWARNRRIRTERTAAAGQGSAA